jgi:hypothetical protein
VKSAWPDLRGFARSPDEPPSFRAGVIEFGEEAELERLLQPRKVFVLLVGLGVESAHELFDAHLVPFCVGLSENFGDAAHEGVSAIAQRRRREALPRPSKAASVKSRSADSEETINPVC